MPDDLFRLIQRKNWNQNQHSEESCIILHCGAYQGRKITNGETDIIQRRPELLSTMQS